MKIDFESKPVYGDDDKYIKTKIKIHADSIITNFHNQEMPQEKERCLNNYARFCQYSKYKVLPQTLLEECKYVQEKTKIENLIDEYLEKRESDSDSNDETESDINNDEYDKYLLKIF